LKTTELIAYLRSRDIRLTAEGDKLRCSAPKGVLTADLRARITACKEEILDELSSSQYATVAPLPPVLPVPRTDEEPLSWPQQRLWFLEQMEPGSPTYNIPSTYRLAGRLDVEALQRSLQEIYRRHEVLRTSFPSREGRPTQVISKDATVTIAVDDLRHFADGEAEARRVALEQRRLPFDLEHGPLLRVRLLRIADDDHVLLITVHHIAFDVWSSGVFMRELCTLYEVFCDGRRSPLGELPLQYADFASWQHRCLDSEALQNHLAYWRRQLEGCPAVLELPADHPRPARQTYRGTSETLVLPTSLLEALKTLGRRQDASLFMVLLAAFQTLLGRCTGQEDFAVGCPIANRQQPELEGLIGFFVNTLVLRANLAGNPSFCELLARVRKVALGAYAHQDLPFEKLVEELQPVRAMSHSPFFQVMFALQNAPTQNLVLPGVNVSRFAMRTTTAKFDLSMYIEECSSGLRLQLEYCTDLFDRETIIRWLGHYQTLLEGIVEDPELELSDLPLLTATQRHQLLVEWNETRRDYPRDACIQTLFEEQVRLNPEAVAVECMAGPSTGFGSSAGDGWAEKTRLTYRQLNERANRVANYLKTLGVGPEVVVGICTQRSPEMVVGILGILKAGGAYLPLDPDYPQQRIEFMLQDTKVTVLLTQQTLRGKFNGYEGEVICLDASESIFERESCENPRSETGAESLAYVIYTSGSTGVPKGVCVEHRAINRLVWETNYIDLVESDRLAQASNASFDAATFELWGALLHGARLCIVPREVTLDPRAFREYLGGVAARCAVVYRTS